VTARSYAQDQTFSHSVQREPRVAVIVPTYNRWDETRIALESLGKSDFRDFQVILIEDGCIDGTADNCQREFPSVHVLHGDGNLWWSGAINKGVGHALNSGAELILWLNDDNRVEPQTLSRLLEAYKLAGDRSIVCGRVKSIYTGVDEWVGDPPIWHADYQKWNRPLPSAEIIPLTHPPGGRGVLIPAICFREVGLVDQSTFPQYWADYDFHYRAMKAGYRYYLASDAVVWNVPWTEPPNAPPKFSLKWAAPYLFGRRSPMNILTIRRLLKKHLRPADYRSVYFPWVMRTLSWIVSGWIAGKPLVHRSLRFFRRILVKPQGVYERTKS
jgi:GT2 family glycosyltransferase